MFNFRYKIHGKSLVGQRVPEAYMVMFIIIYDFTAVKCIFFNFIFNHFYLFLETTEQFLLFSETAEWFTLSAHNRIQEQVSYNEPGKPV